MIAPLVVAAHYGALDIPRSDDWSYLLTLFRLVDHGVLGFNNWVSMTLVGQLALAAPIALVLPRSITAVHVASALLGFVGLVALVQGTERRYRRAAMVLAFTIAIGPLWSPLASTYMTDIPAFAVQCVFLALAFRALRTETVAVGRYALALAVGFLGISIRQYEAIPVIAVVLVTLAIAARQGSRVRLRNLVLVTAVAVAATIALFAWWLALPDALSLAPSPVTSGIVANLTVRLGGFARLVGLLLAPVVILAGPVAIVRRAWQQSPILSAVVGAASTLWMAASYLRVPDVPFVGNYLDVYGVLSRDVLTGPRLPVIPETLFRFLAVVGSAGAIVLALAVVPPLVDGARRVRERDLALRDPVTAVLALSTLGFTVAYSFAIATELPVFDRYVLPVLPLVGLLVIRRTRAEAPATADARGPARPTRPGLGVLVTTVVALVVLGGVGLAYATDSASFDGTRWRLDRAVARQGWAPTRIYGGFEWISWHQKVGPPQGDTSAERIRLRAKYLAPFCVDVVINPGRAKSRAAIAPRRGARMGPRRRADRGGSQRQAVPGRVQPAGASVRRLSVARSSAPTTGTSAPRSRSRRNGPSPIGNERAGASSPNTRATVGADAPSATIRWSPAGNGCGAGPACTRSPNARCRRSRSAPSHGAPVAATRPVGSTTTAVPGATARPTRSARRSKAIRCAGGATSATRPGRPTATASRSTCPDGTACAPIWASSASTTGSGWRLRASRSGPRNRHATSWRGPETGAGSTTPYDVRPPSSSTPIARSPSAAASSGANAASVPTASRPSSTATRTRAANLGPSPHPVHSIGGSIIGIGTGSTVSVTRPRAASSSTATSTSACTVGSATWNSAASSRATVARSVAPSQRDQTTAAVALSRWMPCSRQTTTSPSTATASSRPRARGRRSSGAGTALTRAPRGSTRPRHTRRRGHRRPPGSTAAGRPPRRGSRARPVPTARRRARRSRPAHRRDRAR